MFVYFCIFRYHLFLFLLCVLLESLDFLRPPVKRAFRNTNRSTITNLESRINNIKVLKDFRKKISKDCQFSQSKFRTAESSTSLILKKTTEREVGNINQITFVWIMSCLYFFTLTENSNNPNSLNIHTIYRFSNNIQY